MRAVGLRRANILLLASTAIVVSEPLLDSAHHVRDAHFWCPEHRTLEHADADGHETGRRSSSREAIAATSSTAPFSSSHSRCLHQNLLPERFGLVGGTAGLRIVLPLQGASGPEAAAAPHTAPRVLAYAPKLSPPARGLAVTSV